MNSVCSKGKIDACNMDINLPVGTTTKYLSGSNELTGSDIFFKNIYLFIYLAASGLSCSTWAL